MPSRSAGHGSAMPKYFASTARSMGLDCQPFDAILSVGLDRIGHTRIAGPEARPSWAECKIRDLP